MKTAEERLQALMKKGFDINIECKGIGRNFAMSYEASMKRSSPIVPDGENHILWMMPSHAVGNTLDELLDKLEANLEDKRGN